MPKVILHDILMDVDLGMAIDSAQVEDIVRIWTVQHQTDDGSNSLSSSHMNSGRVYAVTIIVRVSTPSLSRRRFNSGNR